MKTRYHNCNRVHRGWTAIAKCAFPRMINLGGSGPWVVITWCKNPAYSMHQSIGAATAAKQQVDQFACGGGCGRQHEIVKLDWS